MHEFTLSGFPIGMDIWKVADIAVNMANNYNAKVTFNLNGVLLTARRECAHDRQVAEIVKTYRENVRM